MSDTTSGPEKSLIKINIEDEMRGAYLDYAMSVIIGRALPDVRDGLKPVHRRVLYAMYDLGNRHNKPYKKSARVVGDVIGKYHPHGDSAVYDTIVRLAQDFSLRYPLIDGQGNFGSIDGDAAAAMRYTEVRMDRLSDELLADIEKETVDFVPNYDDSLQEPSVLPSKVPNLLVNGSAGIAVGMATNIPPHNLREVIEASIALIEDRTLDSDALMKFIQGPDFPTAGEILGRTGIKKAYRTGRGVITIRGKAEIEVGKNDRERILVTELPYQVNKAKLIEKIADLVRDKKIEGISDLRDESDRDGMRIVIDIRKGEASNVILNRLYKLTPLQESFGITLLAIHHNQPKIFNLRDMLWAFVEHRKEVVLRKTAFELAKAEAKAHVLDGLKQAVENLDPVIQLIRAAKGPSEARTGLMAKFGFSEKQAQAILDMRLQRLTGLERDKIIQDYQETIKLISELKDILAREDRVFEIITTELKEVNESYGDDRKTRIGEEVATSFEEEDLIADEETLVTITHRGFVKRSDPKAFRAQRRGGRGIKGMTTSEGDFMSSIYRTRTHSYLLCFTDKGRMYWLKVYRIPETSRTAKGKAIVNLISLKPGEKIKAVLPVREFKANEYVFMVTKKGVVKKTPLSDFKNINRSGINCMGIRPGDELFGAQLTDGKKEIYLCTRSGKSIRFPEENVRSMGRTAQGVTGVTLENSEDGVISLEVLETSSEDTHVLIVTENGFGKRTSLSEYRIQSRGGRGVLAMKSTSRTGSVVSAVQVRSEDEVMIVSSLGKLIRMRVGEISEIGRVTQGVRIMKVDSNEKVVVLGKIANEDETNETQGNGSSS